jgi:hypothetical protein
MERNYEFCFKHGINDISDAAEYIEYNRNQRRAREQSARFAIDVDQQRKFKRIRLSFPALTYEMTVDDV